MARKEIIERYASGGVHRHYLVDKNGRAIGEYCEYWESGQFCIHTFYGKSGYATYGETKAFNPDGTIRYHFLLSTGRKELATVTSLMRPQRDTTEENLVKVANRHNLPLLSELPKTEAEVTLWNLKYPDCPCLPIGSKQSVLESLKSGEHH